LGLFFRASEKLLLFIILCETKAYVHLSIRQIGFVLHNLLILIDPSSPKGFAYGYAEARIRNNLKIQMTQIQNKLNINERLFLTWIC